MGNPELSPVEPGLLLLVPRIHVVHAAGFEAHNFPLPKAMVVDTRVPILAADVTLAVGSLKVCARSNDGRIAIDANLEIIDFKRLNAHRSGFAKSQGLSLGFHGSVRADADVIVGQQVVHLGHVVGNDRLAPLLLQSFDLFVNGVIFVVRQRKCRMGQYQANSRDEQNRNTYLLRRTLEIDPCRHVRIGMVVRIRATSQRERPKPRFSPAKASFSRLDCKT